ncbi:MAG TPA: hydroxymethylbilane synthase [Solirubrobacteraceae bacterium]|nr:hydroxymethylbilane synthase [Solirubrobacteraceae bacterium]
MRIGTRGSALALAQAQLVSELLGGAELVPLTTSGDRASAASDAPPAATGPDSATSRQATASDKSRWVQELEDALLAGDIDLAVHSAKDVPGELSSGLELLGAPARAAYEDVLCGAVSLDALPAHARVGTSSLRRAAQLRAARPDLEVVALAGNVDTRLRRLDDGQAERPTQGERKDGLHAIVLARAGLQRLGREPEVGAILDPTRFVPAPGQGVLALEGRADDDAARAAAQAITDANAFACLRAERTLAQQLEASCHTPLGAYAVDAGCGCLLLRAWVGLPDGSEWIADELLGGAADPEALGRAVAARMEAAGARELLSRAEELAVEPSRGAVERG